MELDPLWSPGIPEILLKPGWVLAVGSSPQGRVCHLVMVGVCFQTRAIAKEMKVDKFDMETWADG